MGGRRGQPLRVYPRSRLPPGHIANCRNYKIAPLHGGLYEQPSSRVNGEGKATQGEDRMRGRFSRCRVPWLESPDTPAKRWNPYRRSEESSTAYFGVGGGGRAEGALQGEWAEQHFSAETPQSTSRELGPQHGFN